MRAQFMDEENPPKFPSILLKLSMTSRADSNQYLSQLPNGELAEGGGESGRQASVLMRSQLEAMLSFVLEFSYNGSDGACHDPEKVRSKCRETKAKLPVAGLIPAMPSLFKTSLPQ